MDAPVMELVDMRDLGSRAVWRVGSSPFRRTSSEIPNTAPFPACGRKTALCWEFLRFSATIRFAGFVAEMKREMWVWGCISFVKNPHDKLADYTKGVVCQLFIF